MPDSHATTAKPGIVNHLGPDSFEADGLRPFFEYRPLGLKELTGGKVGAHVIRAKPGKHADAPRHTHALSFQFVYVLKMSSLVSVIGLQELTRRANELNVTEYRPLEIYTGLVVEYLALIMIVSWGVRVLERKLARGRR